MSIRKVLCAAALALGGVLGGCSTEEVRSADLVHATQRLCIQLNPEVPAQFLGVLQQAIAANGLAWDTFTQGQQPEACRYVVTYTATRSDATFDIVRDGETVAVGKYHVRGGHVAFARPDSLKAQVDPVLDQLFALYKRNGAPLKATVQGIAPTTFEPVAASRTQVDSLPGRNATDFVPVVRKPSLAGTVAATPPTAAVAPAATLKLPSAVPAVAPTHPLAPPQAAATPPVAVATAQMARQVPVPLPPQPTPAAPIRVAQMQSILQYAQQVYTQPQPAQTAALDSPDARPTAAVTVQATPVANPKADDEQQITYINSPEGAARSIAAIRNCMLRFTRLQQYNGRTIYSSVCWGEKRLLISCESGVCSEMH